MEKPWEIKTNSERNADTLATFIIFCEDQNSEPIYFKYFETSKIKVNVIKDQKSKLESIVNAICHCNENGLLDSSDPKSTIDKIDTYVWCVFDRDIEETPAKVAKGNVSFDNSIQLAQNKGIQIGWSNDSFELWVLLHFIDLDSLEKPVSRKYYYDELTKIFKKLNNPTKDLEKALKYPNFSYKDSLKSDNNFRYIVRPQLIKNIKVALKRAEILERYFLKQNINPHLMNPCTTIHHLVKQLLEYGQKEIS
ncbi:MAG: RloB family protein [Chitinophagales bacterium]